MMRNYGTFEIIDETSRHRRVLKNVELRQGTHGAHMAAKATPLPLVFLKSVIPKNHDILFWSIF